LPADPADPAKPAKPGTGLTTEQQKGAVRDEDGALPFRSSP